MFCDPQTDTHAWGKANCIYDDDDISSNIQLDCLYVCMYGCMSQNVTLHYYSETKKDRKMNFSMMNLSRYGEYEFKKYISISIFVWGGWGVKYPPDTPLLHISSYNSGTKSDKKLIFLGNINAGARSYFFKNRNSYLYYLGG